MRAYHAPPGTPSVRAGRTSAGNEAAAAERERPSLNASRYRSTNPSTNCGMTTPSSEPRAPRGLRAPALQAGEAAQRHPNTSSTSSPLTASARSWEAGPHHLEDRRPVLVGGAEVAAERPFEETAVLNVDRLVEAEPVAPPRSVRASRAGPRQASPGRRGEERRAEGQVRDRPQDDHGPREPLEDVAQHRLSIPVIRRARRSSVGSSASRRPSPTSEKPIIASTIATPGADEPAAVEEVALAVGDHVAPGRVGGWMPIPT